MSKLKQSIGIMLAAVVVAIIALEAQTIVERGFGSLDKMTPITFAAMILASISTAFLIWTWGLRMFVEPVKREREWKRLRTDPELRHKMIEHLTEQSRALDQLLQSDFEQWKEEMRRVQWRTQNARAMLEECKPVEEVLEAFPDVMQQFLPR